MPRKRTTDRPLRRPGYRDLSTSLPESLVDWFAAYVATLSPRSSKAAIVEHLLTEYLTKNAMHLKPKEPQS